MKFVCLIIIALLTIMSCGDIFYTPENHVFDVECINNSEDTLHLTMYGHEMSDSCKIAVRLKHSSLPIIPRSSNSILLWLNWELEPTWENIWYSYGIDTLYVVMSQTPKEENPFERMELPKVNKILKMYKFTKADKPLDDNKITIFYP